MKKQKTSFNKLRFVLVILLIVLILSGGWSYSKYRQFMGPVDSASQEPIFITIENNTGTARIAAILHSHGLIHEPLFFRWYVSHHDLDRQLKAGRYQLTSSMSLPEIVDQLVKGQLSLITFTVPEGLTLEQTAASLEQQGVADAQTFLELTENMAFNFPWLEELPEGPLRLEGFLFPDTYKIPEEYGEARIIQLMLDRFSAVFTAEYQQQMDALGMSILEVVTLASILEREIRVAQELPIASAVFHNRLNRNMRLESCATVQYVLGEVKEVLLYSDLEIESPYNTYRNAGLPPGPIAAPGKSAIEAALFPSDDDYLFFVAKTDGSHHFSRTFREHEEAKARYLP